ncbi:hypothetical protein QUF72_08175, partial [Desulfobacterales bacterium HSG2]|nr:hypothetical protein [Desulfobacterales bacterium HSG2]
TNHEIHERKLPAFVSFVVKPPEHSSSSPRETNHEIHEIHEKKLPAFVSFVSFVVNLACRNTVADHERNCQLSCISWLIWRAGTQLQTTKDTKEIASFRVFRG